MWQTTNPRNDNSDRYTRSHLPNFVKNHPKYNAKAMCERYVKSKNLPTLYVKFISCANES